MTVIRDARPSGAEGIGQAHAASWRAGYAGQFPPEALAGAVAERRTRWTAAKVAEEIAGRLGPGTTVLRADRVGADRRERDHDFGHGLTGLTVEYARRLP